MCQIIAKEPGFVFPIDLIKAESYFNKDGWGLAFSLGDSLQVMKGMSLDKLLDLAPRIPEEAPAFIHMRYATSGLINESNCHPFMLRGNITMAHNGVVHKFVPPKDSPESDTALLARHLSENIARAKKLKLAKIERELVEIDPVSRFILLNAKGEMVKVGKWHAFSDGISTSTTAEIYSPETLEDLQWDQYGTSYGAALEDIITEFQDAHRIYSRDDIWRVIEESPRSAVELLQELFL